MLINNAGVMPPSTLETMTQENTLSVYKINVVGPMLVTKVGGGGNTHTTNNGNIVTKML